jgi:large subunit ribosomal protein L17
MVAKLFGELTERFRSRAGGYTRIIKVGYRFGDNAPVSILEYIPDEKKKEKAKPKRKAKEKKEE